MVGLDLTENQFDNINARVTVAANAAWLTCDAYADKKLITDKGYFMEICSGYEQFFTAQELAAAVEYVPVDEEIIEL